VVWRFAPALPSSLASAGGAMSDNGTVVVVDDLPQNVKLLDAVLSSSGYHVIAPASRPEAMHCASSPSGVAWKARSTPS
jgi:response regulator RpfG family c-di-GMP phosphodiesterase